MICFQITEIFELDFYMTNSKSRPFGFSNSPEMYDVESRKTFSDLYQSLKQYGKNAHSLIEGHVSLCQSLSQYGESSALVEHVKDLKEILVLCDENQRNRFVDLISLKETYEFPGHSKYCFSRICTVLKQIVREWSVQGELERDQSFKRILEAIVKRFPRSSDEIKILTPGCGLGRLTFEIASRGYHSQGNECSVFMLATSSFIINGNLNVNETRIFPWITSFTNNHSIRNQVQPIYFPDVSITDQLSNTGKMEIIAGQFVETYNHSNVWDCVATCFFLDTANNVVEYVDKIYDILKIGGYWINLGPLLYHFSGDPTEKSVDLPLDRIWQYIVERGFEIEEQSVYVTTEYLSRPDSMERNGFKSTFFVCRKK
ncbi:hypothetical protein ACOME3_004832 [Neoechinorhynchus agilis]